MPRLVIERGTEKGVSISLDEPNTEFTIGRLKSCDLMVSDNLASRQHFKIFRRGEQFFIKDLDSHNGTFLEGQRLTGELPLEIGATIRAGETLFVFVEEEANTSEGALAGTKLGGYQLVTRIGVGGMGEVYRALQMSIGREVALKVLSPELTKDRQFVEKFLAEARKAGKFNHPNVIHVHEVDEEKGMYFFSMEFIEGGSVQDLVAKGRKLDQQRATEIILQSAKALEYAEKVGIVHCDIKPDNLMLTGNGDVRLADLGIAKSLNSKGKAEQSDGVFGSPHYMSPEQARGLALDHRSDLYSLGVTYYRLLLGKVPFTGKDAKEIMEKQVYEEPENPKQIDMLLAPMVYTVLGKLLKKKPAERYQNATVLIKDLEAALQQIAAGQKSSTTINNPAVRMPSGRFKRRSSGSGFW